MPLHNEILGSIELEHGSIDDVSQSKQQAAADHFQQDHYKH
jgi:hypothetical protein